MRSKAAVQTGRLAFEMRELEVPALHEGEALLRVEACGLCGSDVAQYRGELSYLTAASFPMIPGHEPVGEIVAITAEAARLWDLGEGDRVAVLPALCCGRCDHCLGGRHHLCKGPLPLPRSGYGFIPLAYGHGLWGGFSEYLVLHPRTLMCKIPPSVPATAAAMYQALAAGLRWAVGIPQTVYSDAVLVLGCGQRGLAAVVALRAAGVRTIFVTGLTRDRHKLAHALRLGATATIVADEEDTVARVMAATGGRGVDVALDVTPGTAQPFLDAIEAVRPGGTIVIAGVKGTRVQAALSTDRILYRELTVRGAFTQRLDDYERAIELLERELPAIAPLHTHDLPLERVAEAIGMLGGENDAAEAICVSVHP